jgi:hypothetical protein
MRYDMNLLERAAAQFFQSGEFSKAIRVYLFMADGDPSLDGGWLGERLGQCYESLGELNAAKYWYGRAIEENPQVRLLSQERRKALAHVSVEDIVPNYLIPDGETRRIIV